VCMLLHCCYTVVTVMSHCYYTVVTLLCVYDEENLCGGLRKRQGDSDRVSVFVCVCVSMCMMERGGRKRTREMSIASFVRSR
jgi:hypothetical protein